MSVLPLQSVIDDDLPEEVSFAVRMAEGRDTAEVLALLAEHMPHADPTARFDWLYRKNPGGPALTWLACEVHTGEIAGLTSFFPFRLWDRGMLVRGALGGDGYVRPAFRRKGVGAMLHHASHHAMRERGIRCMYGAPGSMNVTPLKHGGSLEVARVSRWVRPLTVRTVAQWHTFDGLLAWMLRPRHTTCRLDPMRREDPRVDRVWADTCEELPLAAVRDAAFYGWRFLDAPAGRQTPFVVVDRGRPIAACALERIESGVRIVDLVAPRSAWNPALAAIADHAAQLGADHLDIKLLQPDGRRRRMWQHGMIERESKPFLVMVPEGDILSPMLDAKRWFYTGADSDLDVLE
jgi:GNAT superfamily N-acetyltransferase